MSTQVEKLPVTSNNESTDNKHIHWTKRWMVYSKDSVMDKLTENLDALIKYFSACEDGKKDIIFNDKMESYIQSRLQNIHNLVSSLTLHDEIPQDQYSYFDGIQGELEKEFGKAKESIDLPTRIVLLRDYIDSVIDMKVFDDDEDEALLDSEDENDEDFLEKDIISHEQFIVPDTASIIDVNNECKKRKM